MSFLIISIPGLIWLVIVWFLARRLVRPITTGWIRRTLQGVLFCAVSIAPIVDEIIGRKKFAELCEERAVLTVNSDWKKVDRASKATTPSEIITNRFIPVYEKRVEYSNIDTNKIFASYPILRFSGGIIYRYIFGDGGGRQCTLGDEDYLKIKRMNIEQLLENGRAK